MHAYPPCVPIRNLICFLAFVHLAGAKAAGDMALLVKWKDGPASPAAAAGNARIGSTVTRNFNTLGWQQVLLPKGMSLNEGLAAYRKSGEVLAVEPDRPMTVEPPRAPKPSPARSASLASVTPNDPQYASQWYLKKIGAPTAWETATGSTNVVVAVIDSGVDYTHPDLAPNMWRNPGETGLDANGHDKATNGIDDDGDGYVDDVYGIDVLTGTGDPMDHGLPDPGGSGRVDYHGTGIAGIIGAIGNNSRGIAGLNWSIQLMAIRWDANLDSTDPQYSHATYWSVNLAAWDYVLTMKRRGVNICVTSDSYGQRGLESIAVREAIEAAGREGILSVFTGGYSMNEDLFATFPASFNLPSVINVAGSSASDTLADFGGGQTSDFGPSTVHLAAPAMNILSTTKGGGYAAFNGTSFAVPQVAATAALLLAADPRLTIDEIRAAIFGSVDQPAALKSKLLTSGRLNVGRALGYLTNGPPLPS